MATAAMAPRTPRPIPIPTRRPNAASVSLVICPTASFETLVIHLAPGRYVFFCNLEGHYLGGMHGVLEVSGDASAS